MTLRLFVDQPLPAGEGSEFALPPGAVRHAQVRRVQPGDPLQLFDGSGSDWPAQVLAMGRSELRVRLGAPVAVQRELPLAVTLAVVMPANERMDWLVEKAGELGAAAVQPLMAQHSVLRLDGERAARKQAHWQGVAVAASEQCGRARVTQVLPVRSLSEWLAGGLPAAGARWLLSADGASPATLAAPASNTASDTAPNTAVCSLSGPEGGLAPAEQAAARAAGFVPVSLGPRVLRAETAPLALLAWLGLAGPGAALNP